MTKQTPIIIKSDSYITYVDLHGRAIPRADERRLKQDGLPIVYNDLDLSPYITRDDLTRRLNNGESLSEIIIELIPIQKGHGLDALFKGPRQGPSPALRKFMATHGDETVIDLQLQKTPLSGYLVRFLDLISLNNFSKKVKQLGYDAPEHHALQVTTNRGSYLIERNHVIEARKMKKKAKENGINIDAKIPENLSLRAMIENASDNNPDFWRYRATGSYGSSSSNNCQTLIKDLLQKNNIDHNDEVAVQDAKALVDSVGPAKGAIDIITDTAGTLDRVVYGDGVKRRKKTQFKEIKRI